jgi:hypothetical protein
MKFLISILIVVFLTAHAGNVTFAADVDTEAGLQSFIENAVLSRVPDPTGDAVNVVRAAPELVKKGTLVWLQRKMTDASIKDDMERVDRYQAFYSCLATDDCQALRKLQSATTSPTGEILNIAGTWKSSIKLQYEITQNGNTFSWVVTTPIHEQGKGSLEGKKVRASWRGDNGSGIAEGTVVKIDLQNTATGIEWSNGVIFFRENQ